MLPASGLIMPNSTFINVLLPDPFSPSSPRICPGCTSRSMPSLARSGPKQRTIPRICSSAGIGVAYEPPRASWGVGAIINAPAANCLAMSLSSVTTAAGTTGLNSLPSS